MGNYVFTLMPVGEKGKNLSQPTLRVDWQWHIGHGWAHSVLLQNWVKPGQQITTVCTRSDPPAATCSCWADGAPQTYSLCSAGLAKSPVWEAKQIHTLQLSKPVCPVGIVLWISRMEGWRDGCWIQLFGWLWPKSSRFWHVAHRTRGPKRSHHHGSTAKLAFPLHHWPFPCSTNISLAE